MKKSNLEQLLDHFTSNDVSVARGFASDPYEKIGWGLFDFIYKSASAGYVSYRWILRAIFNREDFGEISKFLSEEEKNRIPKIVNELEKFVITNRPLEEIWDLLIDGPITLENTMRLLIRIGEQTEVTEALTHVFECFQTKYDWNKVPWPEDIRETCQNLAAQVSIAIQLHKEKLDKEDQNPYHYHPYRPKRAI